MKRIRDLTYSTPGLVAYLELEGRGADWTGFRNHDAGVAYLELIETLIGLQHGLCGYCEIDLTELDRQVEHVIPRASPEGGGQELEPANLIACCKGGTQKHEVDNERKLDPIRRNRSCGEAKGNTLDPDFIDPRELPAFPPVVRVRRNGKIVADEMACAETGFAVEKIRRTIAILGLNVERLRTARQRHWNALNDGLEECGTDEEIHDRARAILLPQSNKLTKFFSTNRSFFPMSEEILTEHAEDWV